MKENIVVRPAISGDAKDICFLYETLLDSAHNENIMKESIEKVNHEENNCIFVATINEKVVGTIQVSVCSSAAFEGLPYAVIDFLIVDENYRRNKIGHKLITEAEKYALERKVSCILLVSGNTRKEAHIFYEKMGYDPTVKGFRKDFV